MSKRWTKEEEEYVRNNYRRWGWKKVAQKLNRSPNSVRIKAFRLGIDSGHYFSDKDKEKVEMWLGNKSVMQISKDLKRPYGSIKQLVFRMNLTVTGNSGKLNVNEVARLMGVPHATICRWIKRHNIPHCRVGKFTMISENDLEQFLFNNKECWDATKCETYYFEYFDWFHEKLLEDRKKHYDKVV